MKYFLNTIHRKSHRAKTARGFTLVEALVAISILSISLLGTFAAVQGGLQSSIYSADQITAFYLAQEAVEYVKNVRDQNTLASINAISSGATPSNWLTGLAAVASDPCYFGKTCQINSPMQQVTACSGGFGSCANLTQDSGGNSPSYLFGYNSSWVATNFKREIQFQSIPAGAHENASEITVTVSISWNTGPRAKSFQITQSLFNRQ